MITKTIHILGNLCLSQPQCPNPLNEHHYFVRIPCCKSPHQMWILMMRQDGCIPSKLPSVENPGLRIFWWSYQEPCSPPSKAVCTMTFVQRHMPSFLSLTHLRSWRVMLHFSLKGNSSFQSTIYRSCSLLESSGWNHQVSGSHWKLETTLAWVKVTVNAPSFRFFKFSLQIESGHQDCLLGPS